MRHGNISIFVPHSGCPNQCSFCNQKTITGCQSPPSSKEISDMIETALGSPYARVAQMEIAFFGGSFTAIPQKQMIALLEAVQPYVQLGKVKGIRISTRPDCIDTEVLRLLQHYGVTAVELGAQSMDDRVLCMNKRGHTAEHVVQASRQIKAAGLELGLQMMTGLYGSTDASDLATAQALLALRPDTVRIYPTVVLDGTRLAELVAGGQYLPPDTQQAVALCARLLPLFLKAGIRVIRLGLHSSREVEQSFVAGAYHPAFRELVENQIFLHNAQNALLVQPKGPVTLFVPKGCTSKMTGQKKRNLRLLAEMGYLVKVAEDSRLSIEEMEVRVQTGSAHRQLCRKE